MERRHGTTRWSRRWLAVPAVLVCGLLATLAGTPALAAPDSVNGHFAIQASGGPECVSPVGVCMTGSVTGKIKGTFSFVASSILPTAETSTGVLFTTGDATVGTKDGTISCSLSGTLQISGDGPFVSLCVITGGTDAWTGATGYLRTVGTFTFGSGGVGDYDGKVAAP